MDTRNDTQGWQPIETAPRDGSLFDAWTPQYGGFRVPGTFWKRAICNGEDVGAWWALSIIGRSGVDGRQTYKGDPRGHAIADVPFTLTHWMPLPPPPTSKGS